MLLALTCQRDILYDRINHRVDGMVEQGLFEEVQSLLKRGVPANSQSMQGIGYKEAVQFLNGAVTREACIEKIKQNSRNYAKRQLTWFRRGDYQWFDAVSPGLYESVKQYIGEHSL